MKCCKDHKANKCTAPRADKQVEREELQFLTEDTVPEEKLKLLDASKALSNLLSNPHLRNYLKELDEAPDPEHAIKNAMAEPLFVEFADACLQVIEPPDKETNIYNKIEPKII